MRAVLILGAALLGAGAAGAAPRTLPATPPPATDALQAEAQAFAHQLLWLTGEITDKYVRPVEPADLLHAALSGVYRAARMPVPRDLRARILKAEAADRPAVQGAGATVPGNSLVPAPGGVDVTELLVKVRVEVARSEFLQGQDVLLIAFQAVARSLDPYTVAVTAEEQRHAAGLNQIYDGVGLELEDVAGRVKVRTVLPGSPAQRGGLRPGDEITSLDGKPVGGLDPRLVRTSLQQVVPGEEAVSGVPATVEVRSRRPGARADRAVKLVRERFQPESVWGVARREDNSWDFWLDRRRRIAHVRLGPLAKGTAEELYTVLADLRDSGMRGLVLDLRWCPGGFLHEASGAAELFVGAVIVATVKSREGEQVFRSAGVHRLNEFPVVLLVNGETSGGGELIAAALKDHGRVRVAGQRTLGKASVQTPLFLGTAGLGMKLTTGTFHRPSGKNLHRFPDSKEADDWGVRPDPGLEMRLSADLSRQLKQWWLWQTLRPGSSSEALPLDDPENDPQRQVALAALLEQLEPKVRAKGE
jgi:carboxyl-terminal processing protease